jgi:hypothetical protein
MPGAKSSDSPHPRRLTVFACRFKDVVFFEISAGRQRSAFGRNPLDLAAQFHLLFKQRVSRAAVGCALVGELNMVKRLRSRFRQSDHVGLLSAFAFPPPQQSNVA